MNPQTVQTLKDCACTAIDKSSNELLQLNRQIWQNPELGLEERKAHKLLTEFLTARGFDVTPQWTMETAFGARFGDSSGPTIGVMCEYDALPEIGHACGHNLIAEAGVAAGIGLKSALESTTRPLGNLLILGSPAEENFGGKLTMMDNGCFKGVDFCMMVHPAASDSTQPVVLANDSITVTYRSHASHAAGMNALDAAVLAYTSLTTLRQQMKPSWRMHCIITEGGVKPSIIPEIACLVVACRAPNIDELYELKGKIAAFLEGATKASGCTHEIKKREAAYSNLVSNSVMAKLYQSNAESLGANFPPLDKQKQSVIGSTDMGDVSHVVPSIHPIYGIGTSAVNHSRAYTTATGSDVAHMHTLVVAKAMAMTAIDLFCNEELQAEVKKEFDAKKIGSK